jgi:cation:H+ antiporter
MGRVTSIAPESAPSRLRGPRGQILALTVAFLLTVPGAISRLTGAGLGEVVAPCVFGFAILGSAFLLAWAAEVLQLDVSQGLALTVLALIAVLPEYAVDFTFAYKAGENPDKFAPLALANMTGGNRLLIGVGWSLVVVLAAWRMKSIARKRGYQGEIDTDVALERPHAIEITFLAIATIYSLTLPLKRTLTIVDSVILIGIFVLFVVRIWRAPSEEPHLVGPARLIGRLPTRQRRIVMGSLLAYAAGVIFLCAEPFAESLVHLGEQAGISTFLLVQWVAPLASEAPELLVAALFAWRLNTSAGLGTLLSSKVNQWTLLVGSLPIVYAISAGHLSGLPLDSLQREELFLTAAQSVFAIAILANRKMSVREAWALFVLFISQFVLGAVLPDHLRELERIGVGMVYLVLAAIILVQQRGYLRPLVHDGLIEPVDELFHESAPGEARS